MKRWYFRLVHRDEPFTEWRSFGHEMGEEPTGKDQAIDWAWAVKEDEVRIEVTQEEE